MQHDRSTTIRRGTMFATAVVLSCGLGVFGASAAFADVPAGTTDTSTSTQPTSTTTTTDSAPASTDSGSTGSGSSTTSDTASQPTSTDNSASNTSNADSSSTTTSPTSSTPATSGSDTPSQSTTSDSSQTTTSDSSTTPTPLPVESTPPDTNDNSEATVFIAGDGVDESAGTESTARQEMAPGTLYSADLQGWNVDTEFTYTWLTINVAAAQANAQNNGNNPDGYWHAVSHDPTYTPTEAGWDVQLMVEGTVSSMGTDTVAYSQVIDITDGSDAGSGSGSGVTQASATITVNGDEADSAVRGDKLGADLSGFGTDKLYYQWWSISDADPDDQEMVSNAPTVTADWDHTYYVVVSTTQPDGLSSDDAQSATSNSIDVRPTANYGASVTIVGPGLTSNNFETVSTGTELLSDLEGWNEDSEFSYAWYRQDVDSDAAPVVVSTNRFYTPTSDDSGSYLWVQVTGHTPDTMAGDDIIATSQTVVVGETAPLFGTDSVSYTIDAGDKFIKTFGAHGDDVVYSIAKGTLPDGIRFDADTATFSGTTTQAGVYSIDLVASNGGGSATLTINLTVKAGEPIGTGFVLNPVGAQSGGQYYWLSDGTHGADFTPLQGETVGVFPFLFDKYGNWIFPSELNIAAPIVTSSYPTDVVSVAADGSITVSFPHASPHTISVAYGGFAASAPLQVTQTGPEPGDTTIAPVAVTTTAAAVSADPSLAYTGSDDNGLVAMALGLLGLGGLVTAARIRRRRSQR